MHAIKFFKEFLAAPVNVGAMAASSTGLAEMVTDAANLPEDGVIVEWGPGTGVMTRKVLEKAPKSTFITIEIQEDFVKIMREHFPDVAVIDGSAEDTARYLQEAGAEKCDAIVSGLPWAGFPEDLQDRLLAAAMDVLKPGGRFVTYTYLLSPYLPGGRRFRAKLNKTFSKVGTTPMVWKNLPPAFVYWAEP